MFFVSKQENNKFGVIDTEDGKIDYYTPDELRKFVMTTGVLIEGVRCTIDSTVIEVLKPEEFKVLDAKVFPSDYKSDENEAEQIIMNKMLKKFHLYKLFESSEELNSQKVGLKENTLLLTLRDVDKVNGDLYFGFCSNFTLRSAYFDTDTLYGIIEDSPFYDELSLVQLEPRVSLKDARFKYHIGTEQLFNLVMSMKELFEHIQIDGLLKNRDSVELYNIVITRSVNNQMLAVSLFKVINGVSIPIIINARERFIQQEDLIDGEIYYKCLRTLW